MTGVNEFFLHSFRNQIASRIFSSFTPVSMFPRLLNDGIYVIGTESLQKYTVVEKSFFVLIILRSSAFMFYLPQPSIVGTRRG